MCQTLPTSLTSKLREREQTNLQLTKFRLAQQNKAAAREQLLKIQLELAKRFPK